MTLLHRVRTVCTSHIHSMIIVALDITWGHTPHEYLSSLNQALRSTYVYELIECRDMTRQPDGTKTSIPGFWFLVVNGFLSLLFLLFLDNRPYTLYSIYPPTIRKYYTPGILYLRKTYQVPVRNIYLHSGVTGACPVTTDLIVLAIVRTATLTSRRNQTPESTQANVVIVLFCF